MRLLLEISHGSNKIAVFLALALVVLLLARYFSRRLEAIASSSLEKSIRTPRVGITAKEAKPRSAPMRDAEYLARAALRAVESIVALTDRIAATTSDRDRYRSEIRESVAALVSAIVIADGVIHLGEYTFLKILLKDLESEDQCRLFVEEHAAKWNQLGTSTPGFFQTLADFDRLNQARTSQEALTELQNIVRYTGMADGYYSDAEFDAASAHIHRLKSVFRKAVWTVQWDVANEPPKIAIENTIRRDDFGRKGIL